MQDLEITWPGGMAQFTPDDSPIQVGRSSQAAVPLTEGSVSRRHLELVWGGSVWSVNDSSTHGTYDRSGTRLAPHWTISSDITVRLGGASGVVVRIQPRQSSEQADVAAAGRRGAAGDGNGPFADEALNGARQPDAHVDRGRAGVDRGRNQLSRPGAHHRADGAVHRAVERNGSTDRSRQEGPGVLFPSRRSSPSPSPSVLTGFGPSETPVTDPAKAEPPEDPGSRPRLFDRVEVPGPAEIREPEPDHEPIEAPGQVDPERPAPTPGLTGSHPAVRLSPNSTIISDSTLRLNLDGQDYSFLPGAEITVGRDPSCLIQLDERHSLVSRQHLRITFENGHWWLEDFSSKGTFVDNRQLKSRYKAEGAFIAKLGDDDAGTPMRVITAGDHRSPRSINPAAVIALAAVALIPLAILAVLLTRGGGSGVEPDFAAAKKSTVILFGLDGGQGSGFFVADNLILTNQHVAALSPQMLVGVSREADEPAQIEYATELVANHPFLDVAVLRISNKATITAAGPEISSEPVGDVDLPAVMIGDSNAVTIGDEVFSTGFPGRLSITSADDAGALRLPPVVATSGEAANFTIWPGCSNPDYRTFIPPDSPSGVSCSPGGDVNKGVLLSNFSSGQGASGSAVFHDNEVVAVVYAGATEESNASLNVTTAAFSGWLLDILNTNP